MKVFQQNFFHRLYNHIRCKLTDDDIIDNTSVDVHISVYRLTKREPFLVLNFKRDDFSTKPQKFKRNIQTKIHIRD